MATSVSSERAFSQGGLTITNRRSRLKADIVEALQFLKCLVRQDLIYADPAPSSIVEEGFQGTDGDEDSEPKTNDESDGSEGPRPWDIILDDSDNTLYEE